MPKTTEERSIPEDRAPLSPPLSNDFSPEAAASNGAAEPQPLSNDSDADFRDLWIDDGLGDPLTTEHYHKVPVGKPTDFFRVQPDKAYRRKCEILVLKSENSIGEAYYLIGPKIRGKIDEARPCTLITVVDRLGHPRLWALKEPRGGESDNDAWSSARAVAREGLTKWVKLVWRGRAYYSRDAEEGYAPDPNWTKLPSFSDLIRAGFGGHGIINDESHSVYRDLFGIAKTPVGDADPFC
jgi:hypothetical protein